MRKFAGAMLTVAVLAAVMGAGAAFAKDAEFDGSLYNLKKDLNLRAVQELKGNIDGNEFEDTVTLVVDRDRRSDMADRMWFEVRPGYPANTPDSKKPRPFIVPLPEDLRGFNPVMELKNFVPGEKEQVFLTWDATDKGPRYFSVIEIRANDVRRDAKFLFDSRTMARAILSGEFLGKFRATIHVDDTKTNALLDLTGKKDFYVKNKIYQSNGKLLKSTAISAKRYDNISLGDRDPAGITLLNATIELYGAGDADHVATVNCIMKYDPAFASWKVVESQITPAEGIRFAAERKK